jgi:hypothetical protein
MAFELKRLAYGTAIALLLSPAVASSQDPSGIAPGSRIRITQLEAGKSRRSSGTVVTAASDTVVLKLDGLGATAIYSLARISGLEVSRGRTGHVAAGVGIGFLAGVGTGALVGALACKNQGCLIGSDDAGAALTALAAGIGGVVGMLVGAGIGAHKTDTWEAVPSSNWHVTTVPSGAGRFAFALSAQF